MDNQGNYAAQQSKRKVDLHHHDTECLDAVGLTLSVR